MRLLAIDRGLLIYIVELMRFMLTSCVENRVGLPGSYPGLELSRPG